MGEDHSLRSAGVVAAGGRLCGLCVYRLSPYRRPDADADAVHRCRPVRRYEYGLYGRFLEHRFRRLRGRLRLFHGRRHGIPRLVKRAPDGQHGRYRRVPEAAERRLLPAAGGGYRLHPYLPCGRARAAVCRPLQQEQRFLPELRLALSSVSPDRSPRSLPVRPADLLSGEYHRS